MRHLPGLAPLASAYRGFIIDLWGVVHDGIAAFPPALHALAQLTNRNVLLLSNAPRRAAAARATLRRLGVDDALYTGLLTSGEAVWQELHARHDPWFARLGARVYHMGPARDRSVIEDLGLTRAATPGQADFVVNTGPDDERETSTEAEFLPELRACRAAHLPMICANPDLVVMRGTTPLLCAGALAEAYAALGGEVRAIGKPHPEIYATALRMMGCAPHEVLAIGDSLRTDIAGAAAAGIDSAWVLGGIHADLAADPRRAADAAGAAGLAPQATLPALTW